MSLISKEKTELVHLYSNIFGIFLSKQMSRNFFTLLKIKIILLLENLRTSKSSNGFLICQGLIALTSERTIGGENNFSLLKNRKILHFHILVMNEDLVLKCCVSSTVHPCITLHYFLLNGLVPIGLSFYISDC